MVCPKGKELFRFAQKPKQIEFSRPHLKTMVRDAQEREAPACPQDFQPLVVYRTPAVFLPQGWDYSFICPNCLSYGTWIETGREEDDVVAAAKPRKEAPAFHDETIPLPKRMIPIPPTSSEIEAAEASSNESVCEVWSAVCAISCCDRIMKSES